MANIISKKHLSRRAVLHGMGATIALPLLDAMVPALSTVARAQGATPPVRFGGFFIVHGAAPGYWEAQGSGPGVKFPYIWEPLEPFRKNVLLTSGLWAQSAEDPPGETGSDHWVAAAYLAGKKPRKTTGADIEVGTTIDQVLAQRIGQDNLLPSLELGVEDPGANSSTCGEGYSCAYTNSISWPTPFQPNPMEINPRVVFERMFGAGGTPAERELRRAQQRSILDSVGGTLGQLRAQVAAPDRVRLERYLDDVREIERRLEIAERASLDNPNMETPIGVPESFKEHIELQFDLLALAWQADITRVATLLYARDLTNRTYPESPTPTMSFHGGSHHAEDPGRIRQYADLNRYHVSTLAYFIDKLANTPEGDGTLLDNSLVLYGSNMGNSNQHTNYDVPHVLIGGAGGKLQGDRHLAYPSRTVPTGNLLLSILHLFGQYDFESYGDSTGPLPMV